MSTSDITDLLQQGVRLWWSPRTERINQRSDAFPLQLSQHGCHDPPRLLQLIRPHKVLPITLQDVQEKAFVRVGDANIFVALGVGEIEVGEQGVHGQTGLFGHQLEVDAFVRLHAQDQFVAKAIEGEEVAGDVSELDPDFALALV